MTGETPEYMSCISPEGLAQQKIDLTTGEGLHWTCDPSVELPIKLGLDMENKASLPPQTIMDVMYRNVREHPDGPALRVKRNGAWVSWTWAQYSKDVHRFAKAAILAGLQPHQGSCIIGFNSPEWLIANIGTIFAGGVTSGIYTTNGVDATCYVASHSKSVIAIAEDSEQVEKFFSSRHRLPDMKRVVQYTGTVSEAHSADGFVVSWEDFLATGDSEPSSTQLAEILPGATSLDIILQDRIARQKPGHCCTLIYTSGTTGNPKAVMLSHDNLIWTVHSCLVDIKLTKDERLVSYLPLSHVAAQLVDIYGSIYCMGCLSFANPDALKGSLVTTLQEVRPTVFIGVPRVWEKMEEAMKAVGASNGALKQLLGSWAKSTGLKGTMAQIKGEEVPYGWTIADRLVFSNIKKALGLDQARYMGTSAAPISKETLEYFMSLNIRISEIYGMSECSGPHTLNCPTYSKMFSVGVPFSGAHQKLVPPGQSTSDTSQTLPASEGEICMWGRHVFMGYLHAREATMATIDPIGYMHTGDIGKIDEEGYLFITGRIKELLITAGGENVAPVPIEDSIKAELPFVSNVMIIGDKRKFLTALISLKTRPDADMNPSDIIADLAASQLQDLNVKLEPGVTTTMQLKAMPAVKKAIEEGIARANKKAVSAAQRVQKWDMIVHDFSVASGDLTPTMKLKRKVVHDKYSNIIEAMYEEPLQTLKSNL